MRLRAYGRAWQVWALAAGLCAAACSGSKSVVTTMVVDSAGGTVTLPDQVTLVIPAGALSGKQSITVSAAGLAPAEYAHASRMFTFGPAGLHFAVPAQLTMPVPTGAVNAAVYYSRVGGLGFDSVGGTVTSGAITTSVQYLGACFVADGGHATDAGADGPEAGAGDAARDGAEAGIDGAGGATGADAAGGGGGGDSGGGGGDDGGADALGDGVVAPPDAPVGNDAATDGGATDTGPNDATGAVDAPQDAGVPDPDAAGAL